MSCAPITYTPDGRQGIGVNQPQSGLDYPLVAPSADVRNLLADFYFAYDDPNSVFVHPFRIKWLYGVGCAASTAPGWAPTPTHAADILIVDATGATVFNSTAALDTATALELSAFRTRCWGKLTGCDNDYAYRIYEWTQPRGVCRLVVYQTWPQTSADNDEDSAHDFPTHITPSAAVLDERAVYKLPKRVTSFILPAGPAQITREAVDFEAGWNTGLEVGAPITRGLRKSTPITFSAIPGTGTGKYTDCTNPKLNITSLNGLSGADILLTADKCLWSRVPTNFNSGTNSVTPGTGTQNVDSNCPACCTCEDYVDLANYMNSVRDRYKQIGNNLGATLLAYSDNVSRWQTQRTCRTTTPIKACMTAQRCPYMDVVVQYCNMCVDCADNVQLQLDFSGTTTNIADVVCGYTTITTSQIKAGLFQLAGAWPLFTANLGNVDAGNSASVSFRLEFVTKTPTTVRLTAGGTSTAGVVTAKCGAGGTAKAAITKSLYCDSTGNTVALCY